jgi:2-polyprenyl-6-methoxyphenol hydroxylase-like FAD-dependent oxidoreductase
LLDQVIATNAPATQRLHFDAGFAAFDGIFPEFEGVNAIYGPRRTHLDKILVDAAREAGAEVRESFVVEEVLLEDNRVVGIRGRTKGGASITEKAALVIGADGKRSLLAKAVGAPLYDEKPVLSCAYYSYFSGVPATGGEIYNADRRTIGAWPTNDGLLIVYIAWPIREFPDFRADVESSFMSTIDLIPAFAERVRLGRREERIYGTADLPNFYRKPYGPGWALAGDAGHTQDPITAQGISDALLDAEALAQAIDAGFSGRQPLEAALAAYEAKRNAATRPMYEMTADLASFKLPQIEQRLLFTALQDKPQEISRFLGVLTGAVPVPEFFSPANILRIVGFTGMVKMMASRMHSRRQNSRTQSSLGGLV